MKTLSQLVEFAGEHADRVLLRGKSESLMPLYHLSCPDGDVIIGCPWGDETEKRLTYEAVRHLAREHNATMALFMAEAWTIKRDPAAWANEEMPSQAADRMEVVIAVATDGIRSQGAVWQIVRDQPEGKIISLVREDAKPDGFVGRALDGILPHVQIGHA